jgi:predicted metal-dependent hydrolase
MVDENHSHWIVAFVSDLMFETRIEAVCSQNGYKVSWIEEVSQISPPGAYDFVPSRQPAEHLVGPGADLIELLSRMQPVLLIFDLTNDRIPWREWIPLLTSAPATRRMPVIAYGPHVDAEALESARALGAREAIARSRFVSALPDLIGKHARQVDYAALEKACQEPLSALAVQGLEEFNRGEYFEAHETLEHAWNEDSGPARQLYQGLIQVAVAYLQIERGNYRGAIKMFLRMRQWLDPLPDSCRTVDVAGLRASAMAAHIHLLSLGPARIDEFDRSFMKPVSFSGSRPPNDE